MAVTAIINFKAQSGKRDALIEFLKGVQDQVIAAGCHSIAVHSVIDDDDAVVEVEYWDTKEAHQAFVGAAVEAGAFKPLDDLLAAPFDIQYCVPAKKTGTIG